MQVYTDPNNPSLQTALYDLRNEIFRMQQRNDNAFEYLLSITMSDDPTERVLLYKEFLSLDINTSNRMNNPHNKSIPDAIRQIQKMDAL